jgi:hypothetical protein
MLFLEAGTNHWGREGSRKELKFLKANLSSL